MLPNQDNAQHLFNFVIGRKLGKGLQTLKKCLHPINFT